MEYFDKDMDLVIEFLSDRMQDEETTKNIDRIIATRLKEQDADAADKSGKHLTSSSTTVTAKSSEKKCRLCPVCDAAAEKTCGACKSVSYCSVEHQRLDWKSHKNVCSPFIIKETETMGKGWIAARDLPADTILLEELPVLFGPKLNSLRFCCVGCGIEMINAQNEDRKCSTCSWSVCSAECEKSSVHAENECQFFSTHKMTPFNSDPMSMWNRSRILLIRASNLKLKNKSTFDQMMELQDFKVMPNQNHKIKAEGLFTCMRDQSILPLTRLTDGEYAKLVRIIGVNSFAAHQTSAGEKEMNVLYLQSSRINYSCIPNCIISLGVPPDFKAVVRTAVPVKKGESLTISYYDKIPAQPTSIRQQYLQNEIGFTCTCERCLDPTELGTFMSGITCQSCRRQESTNEKSGDDENVGYFLPENPLDLTFDSKYGSGSLTSDPLFKCNGCGETELFSELKSNLPFEIQEAFEVFDMDFDARENIEQVEAFLAEYGFETGGEYLHKNHYLIHNLTEKIVPSPTKVRDRVFDRLEMERVVRRLEYLLQFQHMLFPGLAARKAVLFVHLMLVVCRFLERFSYQFGAQEKVKWVLTAQTCYKEGMKYFKKDNSSDGQWMPQKLQDAMDFLKFRFESLMDPSI